MKLKLIFFSFLIHFVFKAQTNSQSPWLIKQILKPIFIFTLLFNFYGCVDQVAVTKADVNSAEDSSTKIESVIDLTSKKIVMCLLH